MDTVIRPDSFIWLLFFKYLRKRTSHICSELLHECMEKLNKRTHLLSSEHYQYGSAVAYSFNELVDETSPVGIATILPELRLLIHQYFDIMDYVDSHYGHESPIRARLSSYNRTSQSLKRRALGILYRLMKRLESFEWE